MSADSAVKSEADSTQEEEKQEKAPSAANGNSEEGSNGLSAKLEEKIIRQVEVMTASKPRGRISF